MIKDLTIGRLAQAAGVQVETVRWYEKVGVLASPTRTAGNYRVYDSSDLDRLSFVRRARNLGFSLDQVKTLLNLADDVGQHCGRVDEIADAHLREVDRKIADLQALRHELAAVIASCSGGRMAECRIIEALGTR
jgi:Cu(I)-responsive transcriptional regulator